MSPVGTCAVGGASGASSAMLGDSMCKPVLVVAVSRSPSAEICSDNRFAKPLKYSAVAGACGEVSTTLVYL